MTDTWKEQVTKKNIRYGLTFKPVSLVVDDSHLPDDRCLFCNGIEKNYKPGPDVEFICGSCVQLLLRADPEDLKCAYATALNLGYLRKARAIETFLTEEKTIDRKAKKSERSVERERPLRTVRPARYKVRA